MVQVSRQVDEKDEPPWGWAVTLLEGGMRRAESRELSRARSMTCMLIWLLLCISDVERLPYLASALPTVEGLG